MDRRPVRGAQRQRPSPRPVAGFSELVGDDLYELAGEVDKLATWAGGDEVTDADVELLVAPRAESPPWNLTDAWGARDVGGVLRAAERTLDRTGDPLVADDPAARRQPHEPPAARTPGAPLEAAGVSSAEAAAKLGIKPFPAQKLYGQVRNFSADELDAALIRLARSTTRSRAARGSRTSWSSSARSSRSPARRAGGVTQLRS